VGLAEMVSSSRTGVGLIGNPLKHA